MKILGVLQSKLDQLVQVELFQKIFLKSSYYYFFKIQGVQFSECCTCQTTVKVLQNKSCFVK